MCSLKLRRSSRSDLGKFTQKCFQNLSPPMVEVLQAANQTMHVSTYEFPSNGASLKSPNPLHRMCLPHGGFNSSITESESKESKESTEAEDHTHPHLRANSFARYSSGLLAPLLDLNTIGGGRRIVNILKN